jgi:hypothetical protein
MILGFAKKNENNYIYLFIQVVVTSLLVKVIIWNLKSKKV